MNLNYNLLHYCVCVVETARYPQSSLIWGSITSDYYNRLRSAVCNNNSTRSCLDHHTLCTCFWKDKHIDLLITFWSWASHIQQSSCSKQILPSFYCYMISLVPIPVGSIERRSGNPNMRVWFPLARQRFFVASIAVLSYECYIHHIIVIGVLLVMWPM